MAGSGASLIASEYSSGLICTDFRCCRCWQLVNVSVPSYEAHVATGGPETVRCDKHKFETIDIPLPQHMPTHPGRCCAASISVACRLKAPCPDDGCMPAAWLPATALLLGPGRARAMVLLPCGSAFAWAAAVAAWLFWPVLFWLVLALWQCSSQVPMSLRKPSASCWAEVEVEEGDTPLEVSSSKLRSSLHMGSLSTTRTALLWERSWSFRHSRTMQPGDGTAWMVTAAPLSLPPAVEPSCFSTRRARPLHLRAKTSQLLLPKLLPQSESSTED